MKKLKFIKVMAGTLVVALVLASNPIGASASWKQDSNGWWNTEDEKVQTSDNNISTKENSNLDVTNSSTIQSEFTSEGITLKLEKSVYELGTKTIKFYFINNTSEIQGCAASYAVAKFENNKWRNLTQFTDSYDKSIIVNAKNTEEGSVSLNVLKGFKDFTPGKYRIIKCINSTNFTLEFELK